MGGTGQFAEIRLEVDKAVGDIGTANVTGAKGNQLLAGWDALRSLRARLAWASFFSQGPRGFWGLAPKLELMSGVNAASIWP